MSDRLRLGDFELDVVARVLTGGDGPIHLERQVFDVIVTLVDRREQVVTKEDLLDAVWGDRFVSESALTSRIKAARKALGDSGRTQTMIKTVHGIGYRFIGPVEPLTSTTAATPAARLAPTKPFLGRDHDIEAIEQALTDRRLVTIVGPGGVGKTHALTTLGDRWRATHQQAPNILALAEVADESAIDAALLDAIGSTVQQGHSARESALHHLSTRRGLLLIDNAEHVRRPVADLVRSLLYRCPDLHLIVTSRRRLNVIGEHVHPLGPLRADDAAALFIDHAAAHGARIDPDDPELPALCAQLDGVPLALELAAARAALLSLPDLRRHLDRFLLQAADDEDDGRHGSVEAAMAWSLDELSVADRQLMADLAVAVGHIELEDVEALSADGGPEVAERLLGLCERSLVVATPDRGRSRFRMLEPIRLAARDDTTEPAARARHLHHFVARAERAAAVIGDSPAVDDGIDDMLGLWPNLRAAFDHAEATADLEAIGRLVVATASTAELRSMPEVEQWAARGLHLADRSDAPAPSAVLESIVAARARLALHRGDVALGTELVERLTAGLGPDALPTSDEVLLTLIWADMYSERSPRTAEMLLEARRRTHGRQGLTKATPLAIDMYRSIAVAEIDNTARHDLIALATGDDVCPTLRIFGDLALATQSWFEVDHEATMAHLDNAIERSHRLGHSLMVANAGSFRSVAAASMTDTAAALEHLLHYHRFVADAGLWATMIADLPMVAKVLSDVDDDSTAARLLGVRAGTTYRSGSSELIAGMMVAVLGERLGEERVQALMDEGATLSFTDTAALAIEALERAHHVDR
ncbi:MAG: winged helix-turn-helix domain-containing protein [Actinomycetota bacterium]